MYLLIQWLMLSAIACLAQLHPYPQHSSDSLLPGETELSNIFDEMNNFHTPVSPCETCKKLLSTFKLIAENQHDLVSPLLEKVCAMANSGVGKHLKHLHVCKVLHMYKKPEVDDFYSFLPDFVAALTLMDVKGIDGEYFCHYMMGGSCPRPETPEIDFSNYWQDITVQDKLEIKERQATSRGETFKALHISDIHLSINYTEGAPANCLGAMCCDHLSYQNPFKERLPAPKWGHFHCDAPPSLLQASLEYLSRQFTYDFALFTGDMVDHNPAFISKSDTILEEEVTLRSMKNSLGNVPVYPVMGNHDSYPYSQEPPPLSPYANKTQFNIDLMLDLWAPWLDHKALTQVERTHGGYSIMAKPGLKIISLNSNYWYRWNFYNYGNTTDPDTSGTIQFLIDELQDCEDRGIRAWVQAHVPPGGVEEEAMPTSSSLLTAALERYSDTIAAMFFGHTHYDEFVVLYSHNATSKIADRAINTAWIAPSITPFENLNPSWRYYEVDSDTYEIMDSVTFYADIEPTFGQPWETADPLTWLKEYSARELYGKYLDWPKTEPLNGVFWHHIASRLINDPSFAQEFVRLKYRYSSQTPKCTTDKCRDQLYCFATSFSVDQVADCNREKNLHPNGRDSRLEGVPTFPMPRLNRQDTYDD